ncbi:hypothetical protein EJ04DRAFT_193653 [Polyplosphaeria fusca]|uniref:Uncharacterized protein n=1 Tax=Polyplosphaeria fusca TaxID=682080 RepID=A0A9P4V3K4_9PLEO|nr:hypothetical protein EJ04DRAFT_193653 [Polyplosphaeria fusca]
MVWSLPALVVPTPRRLPRSRNRRMSALSTPSFSPGPAIPQLRMMVRMPYHWKIVPVSDNFSVNSNSSMHLPQDSASLVHGSARCPLAALTAQEPVEPGLEENGDSRQTLHADLPCEVQAAEPTLQGTQSTEPRSQESHAGLAESRPEEHPDTVTSPCEDMHAGLISEGIITAGAAPREEGPTNRDPLDIQPTDVTTQQPELSDLAPREPVGCHSPQETNSVSLTRCETETETEIEIVDLTSCQEPKAASLAPHETAPQVPETADCIRPQGPEIANRAVDETALATKTTNPTQEPGVTYINDHETTEVIPPKTIDPLQESQAGHSPTDTSPALGSLGDTNG